MTSIPERTDGAMLRADLVSSVILLAFGIAVVVESWRMPTMSHLGASPYSAPGLVPGLLGAAMALFAVILLARSVVGLRGGASVAATDWLGWFRAAVAFVLCMVYAGFLVGNLPFWLATFLFVFAFILLFELWEEAQRSQWLRRLVASAVIAALTGLIVSYIFSEIFFVRLP